MSSYLKISPLMGLMIILLIAYTLRLYQLGNDSLWYDETVSAYLAHQPTTALIAHTARDIHPPGYYLLLRGWGLLAGFSEFNLAYFSTLFSLLIVATSYRLSRRLLGPQVAWWTACLVAVSPFQLWYAHEVRMYTLGAWLGLVCAYSLHRAIGNSPTKWWILYSLSALIGLYSLYYFAFLLIALNSYFWVSQVFVIRQDNSRAKKAINTQYVFAHLLILIGYSPWLPTLYRQATEPPVPPWRTAEGWSPLESLGEMWTAFFLGQSWLDGWGLSGLALLICGWGVYHLRGRGSITTFLLTYTFIPIMLLLALSTLIPLYHVRYTFIYSVPMLLFASVGLMAVPQGVRYALAMILVGGAGYSSYLFHTSPEFRADDFRAAVATIDQQWQPDDLVLINAGYTYTAYHYYTAHPASYHRLNAEPPTLDEQTRPVIQTGAVDGSPQLGWGLAESDFYAITQAETEARLNRLPTSYRRVWMVRAYDTVTDPDGVIRAWLAEYGLLIADYSFTGPSNIRVQGFLLNSDLPEGLPQTSIQFADQLTLVSWQMANKPWSAGEIVRGKLWWQATGSVAVDYKLSLKLWRGDGQLMAQGEDDWPLGHQYRTRQWATDQLLYQPIALPLPTDLASGEYWLNVELYDPTTVQPLPRLDGEPPVVTLGAVRVGE